MRTDSALKTYSAGHKEEFAHMFNALGHPRRIAIFLVLQKLGLVGCTYAHLAEQAKIAEPSLAHHLKVMKKGGIVDAKPRGAATILTLNPSWLQTVQSFLAA